MALLQIGGVESQERDRRCPEVRDEARRHAGEALALGRADGVLLDPATEQRGADGVGGGEEEGLDAVGQVRREGGPVDDRLHTYAARLSGCGSGVRCASRSIAPSCSGRHAHRGLC